MSFIIVALIMPMTGSLNLSYQNNHSLNAMAIPKTFQVYGNQNIHKIKHVVETIEENQAFDTIFGTYPYGYTPIINNITNSVMKPTGLYWNVSQLENSDGTHPYISIPKVPWMPFLGSASPY